MIRRMQRARSGVTLTEILISIMILGVGIVSLATLFPLGLLRLRDAARASRSTYLFESAAADLGVRNLLGKSSFQNPYTSPWYTAAAYTPPSSSSIVFNPWLRDTPSYGSAWYTAPYGAYRGDSPAPPTTGLLYQAGPGLPVAYDPLWRTTTNTFLGGPAEARFACGLGFVRPDPNPGNATDASAHGLRRLTNFPTDPNLIPNNPAFAAFANGLKGVVNGIFVSPEDVVLQTNEDTSAGTTGRSTVVPDMPIDPTTNQPTPPQNDWRYTWMVTGQQADATNSTIFDVDIVIFENRPFGLDSAATTFATNGGNPYFSSQLTPAGFATGETVVEAVFGYTNLVTNTTGNRGYGGNASRTVLLRWSDKMPDPDVKVGSWFADVTYERNATEDHQRSELDANNGGVTAYFPYQRCYWYQVAKRTQAGPGVPLAGDPSGVTYRQMVVWTTSPVRAFTLLSSNGQPYHVNAALVSPYVVNVFSRTIYTR